jgi:predicted nucleotidyltransferase
MRLLDSEIELIKSSFKEVFEDGYIYLFGSRVDDSSRGGDIDLFIIPKHKLPIDKLLDKKSKFRLLLEDRLGEQSIDIVISKDISRAIEIEALSKGVRL